MNNGFAFAEENVGTEKELLKLAINGLTNSTAQVAPKKHEPRRPFSCDRGHRGTHKNITH